MTNTSLHTRYRPTKWKEIVGQEDTVKSLKKVVKDKRAKVFLFTGPAGTGKTTLARILANAFAGGNASAANIEEVPAAKVTGVDGMRSIADRAHYRAIGSSPVKAIILDEAHRLSGAAWDALLKPIEEPPSHVYWMFCTTNISKVPQTIQTRCLKYELKPVEEDKIEKLLRRVIEAEKFSLEEEVIEAIAEASEGSPRQALVYLEACAYCESASEARKVMQKAGQTKEVVDLCRFLLQKSGRDWKGIVKHVKDLKDTDAESIRIVICNYLSAVAMGTTNDKQAVRIMSILEQFETPYNSSDKMAPLLLSLARAINLGE